MNPVVGHANFVPVPREIPFSEMVYPPIRPKVRRNKLVMRKSLVKGKERRK